MSRRLRALAAGVVLLVATAIPALAATPAPSGGHDHGAPVDLGSPAAELRVTLDRLLAEHAFLLIEQMRGGLADAPDFAAAATAVEGNSTDVANAIGDIYGAAAVEPFGDIWRSHVGYLVDFSIALRKDDAAAQQKALDGLATYRTNLRTFLTDANPGVPLGGISDALDAHTAQLLEFIKTEAKGDHAGAYAIERHAYPHMFEVGDALAKVIANRFPDRFTGVDVAYSAAGTLRVTLDRLLAEHAFLAAEAMRSGVTQDKTFDAATGALDGNSSDLEALVAAAYGADAGTQFGTLWRSHITGYVAYINATRANDATARTKTLEQLNDYAAQIATFLGNANPHLDAAALATLFQEHAQHLAGQVEAFAAADYDNTYDIVRTGYRHMFDAGEALATGIAQQLPEAFPADAAAPATDALSGAGPSAGGATLVAGAIGFVLGLLVAMTVWLFRRVFAGRPVES
jgi:hypothetical protein